MASEDLQKIAHLMRRAGFGATSAELEQRAAAGIENTIHQLMNAAAVPKEDAGADALLQGLVRRDREGRLRPQMLQPWWMYRMVSTQNPLLEKMTLFWHGH